MKYALVTGGSRGIGRAICIKLGEMGYHVLVNYFSNDKEAIKTLNLIKDGGGTGELLKFDVSSSKDVETSLGGWIESNKDKCIDTLVNNAGIRKDALMMWMKDSEWSEVLNTNLSGFYYVTRILLKGMLVNKCGTIVNIVSLSGIKGLPGQTNYSAAKGGLIGATKALAQELGKRNIRVNAVAPGFIKTDMTQDIDDKDYKPFIPLKRFGSPDEVAEVVGFLVSERSSYITGEVINVNGGLYT